MSSHTNPPPSPSPYCVSPAPPWEETSQLASFHRTVSRISFSRQSFLGRSSVKLGITLLIQIVLRGHSMTCFDRCRKELCGIGVERLILKCPKFEHLDALDYYWVWEQCYRRHTLEEFLEILITVYAQVWVLVRQRLTAEGFMALPTDFSVPKIVPRTVTQILSTYSLASAPQQPFIEQHGRVRIVIPPLPAPSSASTSDRPLRRPTARVLHIDELSEEVYERLVDHMVRIGRAALAKRHNDIRQRWNLLGVDDKEHELGLTALQLQNEAWAGDAFLFRLSLEVLMEITPVLPLGCIKAVTKTFNSNALQSDLGRRRGFYRSPYRLSRREADHLGGTFVEGPFNITYSILSASHPSVCKNWVKDGLEFVLEPLVAGYAGFFNQSPLNCVRYISPPVLFPPSFSPFMDNTILQPYHKDPHYVSTLLTPTAQCNSVPTPTHNYASIFMHNYISITATDRPILPLPRRPNTSQIYVNSPTKLLVGSQNTFFTGPRAYSEAHNNEEAAPQGVKRALGDVDLNREGPFKVRINLEGRPVKQPIEDTSAPLNKNPRRHQRPRR